MSNAIRFSRCPITPETFLNDDYLIWTLDFPFYTLLSEFRKAIYELVKDDVNGEWIGIPDRVLNDTLMVVAPILTSPFEWIDRTWHRQAIVIQTPDMITDTSQFLPSPNEIWLIIRRWIIDHWLKRKYMSYIDIDQLETMRDDLLKELEKKVAGWQWKPNKPSTLIEKNNSLIYSAIPSLLASLLHGKISKHGSHILHWRKVQENNGKLSIIGFQQDGGPFWTTYDLKDYLFRGKSGDGYFAYKVVFHLETQSGVDHPWLHIDLHAQRYSHEKFESGNEGNNISFLVGANKIRLKNLPIDNTLITLKADPNHGEWRDDLANLLDKIGLSPNRQLQKPRNLLENSDPTKYWRPDTAGNEYYLIHDTGYKYGNNNDHDVMPGYSIQETEDVLQAILQNFPMLTLDKFLIEDQNHIKRKLSAMRTHEDIRDKETVKNRRKNPALDMQEVLERALSGQEMQISLVYYNQDTCDALCMALRQVLKIHPDSPYPLENIKINTIQITDLDLYESFKYSKANWSNRVKQWQNFIKQNLEKHHNHFAIVELFVTDQDGVTKAFWNDSRGYIHGTIRQAFAEEVINTQMIRPISLKHSDDGRKTFKKGDSEHRAMSAVRDLVLRQTGALFGNPQEVFKKAGMQEDVDLLAFYLRETNSGIFFPVAVRITKSGAVEACFPMNCDPQNYEWQPYHLAQTALGSLFTRQRKRFLKFDTSGKKWKLKDTNHLYLKRTQVFHFVYNVMRQVDRPTIVTINAQNWRNNRTWTQLRVKDLYHNRDVLDFGESHSFDRNHELFKNILAVVRLREGKEVAQYITDDLKEAGQSNIAGYIDNSVPNMMAYISIGKKLITAKDQQNPELATAHMEDGAGASVAYKYPRAVELVPSYVRSDYQTDEGLRAICRCVHYMRVSPAWDQGSLIYPYPTHLGQTMINDQLTILGLG